MVVETDQDPGAGGGQDPVEEIEQDLGLDLETGGEADQDLATNVQDRDQNLEIDPATDPEAETDLNQVIDLDDYAARHTARHAWQHYCILTT